MKTKLSILLVTIIAAGCAHFNVHQTSADGSTTDLSATAVLASIQDIAKADTKQTPKTQSIQIGDLHQQGDTNAIAYLQALAALAQQAAVAAAKANEKPQ